MKVCDLCAKETKELVELAEEFRQKGLFEVCDKCIKRLNKRLMDERIGLNFGNLCKVWFKDEADKIKLGK